MTRMKISIKILRFLRRVVFNSKVFAIDNESVDFTTLMHSESTAILTLNLIVEVERALMRCNFLDEIRLTRKVSGGGVLDHVLVENCICVIRDNPWIHISSSFLRIKNLNVIVITCFQRRGQYIDKNFLVVPLVLTLFHSINYNVYF
jgi:hypothetical protein